NRYITVFQQLNLTLVALEVETFPLVRSLLSNPPTSTLLVDIGAHATTFHVIDKGIPRVSQTIDVGGYDLTKNVTQDGGTSEVDGEKAKIEFGILPQQDPVIRTALTTSLDHQAEKAKELLAVYEQKEKHRIETCVLIGGGANLKGLPEYWSEAIGMQTVIGNPWKVVQYDTQLEGMLKKIGPRYGVSVGLALRGFAQQ
ncbi:MAG: pilus assembly protein PilM, partial [Candidatus Andersenbacteria bacterium]